LFASISCSCALGISCHAARALLCGVPGYGEQLDTLPLMAHRNRRDVLFHLPHPLRSYFRGRTLHQAYWTVAAKPGVSAAAIGNGGFGDSSGMRDLFRCAREALHASRLAAKSAAVDYGSNGFAITQNGGARRSMTSPRLISGRAVGARQLRCFPAEPWKWPRCTQCAPAPESLPPACARHLYPTPAPPFAQ